MLNELYNQATGLFDFKKIDNAFLGKGDIKKGLIFFAISTIISTLIQLALSIEIAHFQIFTYDTISKDIPIEEISVSWEPMVVFSISRLVVLVPFMFAFSYIFEFIAFKLLKITGGKGDFSTQFYYASIIAFSITLSSLFLFLSPIPCLGFTFVIFFLLLNIYFNIYVTSKAYSQVHGVDLKHAIAIVLILLIPRIIAVLAVNEVFGLFGLPESPIQVDNYV